MKFQQVDLNGSAPLYLQIADMLRNKIINKEISAGEKLPQLHDFSRMLNVSHITMSESLSILAEEGYISSRPRHGTFVISSQPQKGTDLKRKNEIQIP